MIIDFVGKFYDNHSLSIINRNIVTKLAEAHISKKTVFATNTSTLPISDLAQASKNKSNFIGIHFFSPVNKMNLVEIIKGKNTEDSAVGKALDYVRQIKKTPIKFIGGNKIYCHQ